MSCDKQCQLCSKDKAKYSCPRCNILYCSVPCYKSKEHLQCSENFYRKCIEDELAASATSKNDATKKMHDILKRMQDFDGNENIEELFEPPLDGSSGESDLDSDDDTPAADLASRLNGVDINDPESVWSKLTPQEQREFEALVNAGDVSSIVPLYTPWWMHEKKLIQDATSSEEPHHPEILSDIRNFRDISNKSPAPCVQYNLTNILAAYCFAVRYFNGDFINLAREFSSLLVNISGNIKSNSNYDSDALAIESVVHEARTEGIPIDRDSSRLLKDDVEMIIRQKCDKTAVLAALSDIHRIFLAAKNPKRKIKSSQGVFSKMFVDPDGRSFKEIEQSRIGIYLKKIEFLLAFAKDIL
uniref:Putative hit zinc finger family protein n=1 Tax=Nyssomyia neivai TaxID=330878 RepID=A0A1L8DCQ2_9DIPT